MSDSRRKRLDKAQMRVLFQVPFFAPGVARLPVEFVPEADYSARFGSPGLANTACTDGERLYWCAEWYDSLQDQELVTLLCHEVCHCLLGHLWRMPSPQFDHGLANEAADHAVNLMLKEFAATVTAKRLADPFPFPADAPGLADPQYAGMAEESIYARLNQRPKAPQGGKGKAGAGGQPGAGAPSFGQFQPAKGKSAAAAKALHNGWEGTLIQSVAAMKGRGDLPASMDRLVGKLVSPSVDWFQVLRSWLREQCADDWDFLTPAMEYSDGAFILPSLKSEKMGPVVFGSDWSGSTSEFIGLIHVEKQNCLDQMRPSKLIDLGFDTQVQWFREYAAGDEIESKVNCGGGTSFKCVWAELEKRGVTPKCVVMVTDGDGEFGDDPGFPVIWCVFGNLKFTAPFGMVVLIDSK